MVSQVVEPVAAVRTDRADMRLARVAGALYLPMFVLGPFALLYVPDRLIVSGDAAATADRLAAHAGLLRAGTVVELYLVFADVALAAIFYLLMSRVSRPLALVASFFRLTWAAIGAVAILAHVAALMAVSDADKLLLLDMHKQALAVGFVAFGTSLAILGYLIWRSGILARPVGILLVVGGACYVANSLLMLGMGEPSNRLVLLPAAPAELSLCLWLLVKGVREVR